MKKATNQTVQRKKLVVRRESIALLTPRQLGELAAGELEADSWFYPCRIRSNAIACVVEADIAP